MALKKTIILDNGIPVSYHRIAEIQNIVNRNTRLLVYSYINEEQRNREKNHEIRYSDDIYIAKSYEDIGYNDTLIIEKAYEYLKHTPKYEGAEDVFEEGDE